MAVKNRLLSVLAIFAAFTCLAVLLPSRIEAATTEPVNLNVYVDTGATSGAWTHDDMAATASVGSNLYVLKYTGTSGGKHHYYFNKATSDPSTGWTIRVHLTKNCGFLNWNCKPYDHSISGTIYTPSAWNADSSGVHWAAVNGQKTRPKPATSTETSKQTFKNITGKLAKSKTNIFSLNNSNSSSSSDDLYIGRTISNIGWDTSSKTGKVGDTYTCRYYPPLSSPTTVTCKSGTTAPTKTVPSAAQTANASVAASASSAAATTPATPVGFTFTFGKNIPLVNGCNGTTTYTTGLLKGMPCDKPIDSLEKVEQFVLNIVNQIILPLAGLIFTIMIIVGGIVYITSAGNTKQIERGKAILTAAIIGLIITVTAFAIVSLFASFIGGGVIG